MKILIYGVNSQNKGAQLLLAAAAERLIHLGHTPMASARDVDAGTRWSYGVRGMFSIERLGPLRSLGLDRIPRKAGDLIPLGGDSSFDYVLDASGFSLTDSWGMAPVTSRLSRLSRWARKGIGFSMLPQAFGPFEQPNVAAGVKAVFSFADRIWARDPRSREYAVAAMGIDDRFAIAPDITIGLEAHPHARALGATLLVPNWNLTRGSGADGREAYVSALVTIARGLQDRGSPVIGLCHEGPKDLAIIQEVASRVRGMSVVNPTSGMECKNIIAGARLVVGGRYHALVSALSTGVPAIAHSWSHKYQALYDDFGVSDGLADPRDGAASLARIDRIDESERARLVAVLPGIKAKVDQTWHEVAALLDAHQAGHRPTSY